VAPRKTAISGTREHGDDDPTRQLVCGWEQADLSRLGYDVFINEPPPQHNGDLPSGEPKGGSPVATMLVYGDRDAVLTDPGFTVDQAAALGDRVPAKDKNVTDIYITHGHGDYWFAAGLLADRFGAQVMPTTKAIAQMHGNVAARPGLWDRLYPGLIPPPR
jgi:glyoxylase-like metal-dependent hydrolase (beta-lactamase superfamily II)